MQHREPYRDHQEPVEVTLELRQEKEKGMAFFAGKYEQRDGRQREVWVWLPKSQLTHIEGNTYEVPLWLAKDKGLI